MECKECGTNVDREAHDNGICFDCYCLMDLRTYEEHQKKSEFEEMRATAIELKYNSEEE